MSEAVGQIWSVFVGLGRFRFGATRSAGKFALADEDKGVRCGKASSKLRRLDPDIPGSRHPIMDHRICCGLERSSGGGKEHDDGKFSM